MNVLTVIFVGAAVLLAMPVMVVAAEVLAALLSRRGNNLEGERRPHVTILMPAHDEALTIGDTLAAVMPQLLPGDRALVIADNCSDGTAEMARACGAEVIERHNDRQRGKGFALAAGVEHLASDPPEVVIILDADTVPTLGSIDALARAGTERPAQGLYLMDLPARPTPKGRLSALAFAFKNHVRALGAERLGVPCLLRGTGMAFPWRCLAGSELATDNLVEDMQLGIDLTMSGVAPVLCASARVIGRLPDATSVAAVQRTRWEHGHMQTILRHVPRLMGRGLLSARPRFVGLALDIAVPPLALLCAMWLAFMLMSISGWILGLVSLWPVLVNAGTGLVFSAAIFTGWAKFARHLLPARLLLAVPFYILWKIPLYFAFLWKRQRTWIRTERTA